MTIKKSFTFILTSALICSLFLFVSTADAKAKQPKGSQIAGEFIQGKTDQEARDMIEDAITVWQAGDDIIVKSEYEIFELSRTALTFDVEATMNEFKQKTKRKITSLFMKPKNVHIPLHVKLNSSHDMVQQMKKLDYINIDQTFADVTAMASTLDAHDVAISYADKNEIPFEPISEVTIDLDTLTHTTFEQLLHDLNNQTIKANDSFSFIQHLLADETSDDMNEDASFIAGKMYKLFLHSNFQIAERSIHTTPPANLEPGYDVLIDGTNNKDLIVVNPNDISYIFKVEQVDNEITLSLASTNHTYTYDVELDEKEIEPRTVYRYSEKLAPGEQEVIQEGIPGTSVVVERLTYNDDRELRHTEFMSHDIYTLIPTIILVSYKNEETVQEDALEEQVGELENTIETFENELAEIKEDTASHTEAAEMIASLSEDLQNIQVQQADFMNIIANVQEQINDANDPDAIQLEELYDNLEEQLTAIDERLETLEQKMDELDDSSE